VGRLVSRPVERLVVWGGGALACFLLGSLGAHPLAAAALGLLAALMIAAAFGPVRR
jgi:hypothetical protein